MNNPSRKPNIVFVFADQLRYDALGCSGNPLVRTPHIDALAAQGVIFEQAFSNCPVCSPFRGLVLSGKYPHKNGVIDNEYALQDNEDLLPRVLKRAGYHTGFVGKLHLGDGPYPEEKRFGFDRIAANNCCHRYYEVEYHDNEDGPIPINKWAPEGETDLALDFIDQHRKESPDSPFALFLAWGPPHWPYDQFPEEFDQYKPEDMQIDPNVPKQMEAFARKEMALYLGNVTGLDHQIGRIMRKLKALDLEENTIVCFSSDHGDHLSSHGQGKPGDHWMSYFHRASKVTPYEESIRIPLIIQCPGARNAGQKTSTMVSAADFMPTLLSLCGLDIPGSVQGTDVSPAITDDSFEGPDSVYLQIYGDAWPFRSHQYRKIDGGGGKVGNRFTGYWRAVRTNRWLYARWHEDQYGPMLFDLENDCSELKNLAGLSRFRHIRAEMESRLKGWIETTEDPFDTGPRNPETGMLQIGQTLVNKRWIAEADKWRKEAG